MGNGMNVADRGRLWIDADDALDTLVKKTNDPLFRAVAYDLITDGFSIIRGAVPPERCDEVVASYGRYVEEHSAYVSESLDENGREKRLVSFHHWSEPELRIGTDKRIMEVLDFLFGEEACVYTSLTFKYGTQQPVHRDTPFFATWPDSYFFGVWTALEDVDAAAGPLQYYPGGHRFKVDQLVILKSVESEHPNLDRDEQLLMALDRFNDEVIRLAQVEGRALRVASMKKGDTAIWHPQLPHGGSVASNPDLSRWSVVFHCAPTEVQVHQHERFFSYEDIIPPPPRYGYKEAFGRKIALAGDTAFM